MNKNRNILMTPIQSVQEDQDQLSTPDHNHHEMSGDKSGAAASDLEQIDSCLASFS